MIENSRQDSVDGYSRIGLFLALSRTPHGLLDMTTPAFAALLWLGGFPPLPVLVAGVVTAFAGYTAVYALNDVVGFRSDREKFLQGAFSQEGADLDAVMVRHPMAQGVLPFGQGLAWSLGWGAVALIGAWWLNPVCLWIFAGGALLEAVYCVLWRVSPFRALVSGAVKTLGAVAAVFAVDPSPSPVFVAVLFLCFFFWELGGQNVPNDWADRDDDRRFGGRTIPVCFGPVVSRGIILGTLFGALACCGLLFHLKDAPFLGAAAVGLGAGLMLPSAINLCLIGGNDRAMALFNRASYFPPMLFALVLIRMLPGAG